MWLSYMDKLWTDAEMEALCKILRNYEQLLTKELIDADAESMACYYLSRLQDIKILAYWEDKSKALFNYISKLRSLRGDTRLAYAASQLNELEEEFAFLARRAMYDRVAHKIVSIVAEEHIRDRKLFPYIPLILQLCIEEIVGV